MVSPIHQIVCGDFTNAYERVIVAIKKLGRNIIKSGVMIEKIAILTKYTFKVMREQIDK